MHLDRNGKAISAIFTILLMLIFAIIGGLLAYLWVMSNYYVEPQNVVALAVTDLIFPVENATYFNFTVLNPSHSISGTNITGIYVTGENVSSVYNITQTSPSLPIFVDRATSQSVQSTFGWSDLAGQAVTLHLITTNASEITQTVHTQNVKLHSSAVFDETRSIKYFNVTVQNDPTSAINVTLSNVYFNYLFQIPDTNVTLQLPTSLSIGTSTSFACFYDWDTVVRPAVRIVTTEGYYVDYVSNASAAVHLQAKNAVFDENNSNQFNVTVTNPEESATNVTISQIGITEENGTQAFITGPFVRPALNYVLAKNSSQTFTVLGGWSWMNYRNLPVNITVYTTQGFTANVTNAITPPSAIIEITSSDFNLTDTTSFRVNVTNAGSSLQTIDIAQILINSNAANFTSQSIAPGNQAQFICTNVNWTDLRGATVSITANTTTGFSATLAVVLPSLDIQISSTASFDVAQGVPYTNITITNTGYSVRTINVTGIFFTPASGTAVSIDGTIANPRFAPGGLVVAIGTSVSLTCPWNWSLYPNTDVTVLVQTAEGITASQTFHIP